MTPEAHKALETLDGALRMDVGTILERKHTKGLAALATLRAEIERLETDRAGYLRDFLTARERSEAAEARVAEPEGEANEQFAGRVQANRRARIAEARVAELEAALRHELGVTHGEDTKRRLREALDPSIPADPLTGADYPEEP